ncbi:MAG TPA: hypothetical protein VFH31_07165, partial [Pyrinomonadaceae bacterium]|nr:hypothetical protein [Pyrinomonadaceae bacterium]
LLKAGLASYGIGEPERFLGTVGPELITTRLRRDSEKSVLIAPVRDERALRHVLFGKFNVQADSVGEGKLVEIPGKEIAVSFFKGNILIGQPDDVRVCLESSRSPNSSTDALKPLAEFVSDSDSSGVKTCARDEERVLNFLRALARMEKGTLALDESQLRQPYWPPYSFTETTLGEQGVERRTQSFAGQFGNLMSMLFPDQ